MARTRVALSPEPRGARPSCDLRSSIWVKQVLVQQDPRPATLEVRCASTRQKAGTKASKQTGMAWRRWPPEDKPTQYGTILDIRPSISARQVHRSATRYSTLNVARYSTPQGCLICTSRASVCVACFFHRLAANASSTQRLRKALAFVRCGPRLIVLKMMRPLSTTPLGPEACSRPRARRAGPSTPSSSKASWMACGRPACTGPGCPLPGGRGGGGGGARDGASGGGSCNCSVEDHGGCGACRGSCHAGGGDCHGVGGGWHGCACGAPGCCWAGS